MESADVREGNHGYEGHRTKAQPATAQYTVARSSQSGLSVPNAVTKMAGAAPATPGPSQPPPTDDRPARSAPGCTQRLRGRALARQAAHMRALGKDHGCPPADPPAGVSVLVVAVGLMCPTADRSGVSQPLGGFGSLP